MMKPEHCRAARGWLDVGQAALVEQSGLNLYQLRRFEDGFPIGEKPYVALVNTLMRLGIRFTENGLAFSDEPYEPLTLFGSAPFVVPEPPGPTEEMKRAVYLYRDEAYAAPAVAEMMNLPHRNRVFTLLNAYERLTGETIKRHPQGYKRDVSERIKRIAAEYIAGANLRDLSEKHGVSYQRISQMLDKYEEKTGKVISRHRAVGPKMTEPTADMTRVATLYKAGMTFAEIREILPNTRPFYLLARYEELTGETIPRHDAAMTEPTEKMIEAARLYKGGARLTEIAERIGEPVGSIHHLVRKYQELSGDVFKFRGSGNFQRANKRTAPTPEMIELVRLYREGLLMKDIAERLGKSVGTLSGTMRQYERITGDIIELRGQRRNPPPVALAAE
jgi:transposase